MSLIDDFIEGSSSSLTPAYVGNGNGFFLESDGFEPDPVHMVRMLFLKSCLGPLYIATCLKLSILIT